MLFLSAAPSGKGNVRQEVAASSVEAQGSDENTRAGGDQRRVWAAQRRELLVLPIGRRDIVTEMVTLELHIEGNPVPTSSLTSRSMGAETLTLALVGSALWVLQPLFRSI